MNAPSRGELTALAARGLVHGFEPEEAAFSHTVRCITTKYDTHLVREGFSPRYTAIVALGLNACSTDEQRSALGGSLATALLIPLGDNAITSDEPGAVALTAWAIAEISGTPNPALLKRLHVIVASAEPLPTVETAWILTAAVAALRCAELPDELIGLATALARSARERLALAIGARDIFAHVQPAASLPRWRAHVACFADQVYPIQALSRWAAHSGDTEALAQASRTATQICAVQGLAGQWWWHYDTRTGGVLERYPVYSVHQHAMAPMALLDLAAAGGGDHQESIDRGLGWLDSHPETAQQLISERFALIWRKVGRREPRKAARAIAALTTSMRAGWTPRFLDTVFPVGAVDLECRPYELGWLLYTWLVCAPAREAASRAAGPGPNPLQTPEGDAQR